jgi:hypothetical protein
MHRNTRLHEAESGDDAENKWQAQDGPRYELYPCPHSSTFAAIESSTWYLPSGWDLHILLLALRRRLVCGILLEPILGPLLLTDKAS